MRDVVEVAFMQGYEESVGNFERVFPFKGEKVDRVAKVGDERMKKIITRIKKKSS